MVSFMSSKRSPVGAFALSHSGRPCKPFLCRNGRYSVGVPSGGEATGRSSQRCRTSKVRLPSSKTLSEIRLRATVLLSSHVFHLILPQRAEPAEKRSPPVLASCPPSSGVLNFKYGS